MWIGSRPIISQIKHKELTDERVLWDHCLRRAHEKEFFIRKAIGGRSRDRIRGPGLIACGRF